MFHSFFTQLRYILGSKQVTTRKRMYRISLCKERMYRMFTYSVNFEGDSYTNCIIPIARACQTTATLVATLTRSSHALALLAN